jgi:hypothetical protein
MRMPGKVYGALLAKISRGFKSNKRKREPEKVSPKVGSEELKTVTQRPSALAGAVSAGVNRTNSTAGPTPASGRPTTTAKATKADNTAIPTYLWNEAAICRGVDRLDANDKRVTDAFDTIRTKLLLPFWKKKVVLDLCQWLYENRDRMTPEEYEKSAASGRRAIEYVGKATRWKWDAGSHPFFWRWPEEYQKEIRDGLAPRFIGEPPRCNERQRVNPDPELKMKEKEKIDKVISFGYLVETCWESRKSLMHFSRC